MRIHDATIYMTDGGRYCGQHLPRALRQVPRGNMERVLLAVTPVIAALTREHGFGVPTCQICGRPARARAPKS